MDEFKRPFGASVRAWRKRLGISQEQLAARAGLHRTYVCDVERGARNVSLISIERLARALEISTARLFSYEKLPPQGVVIRPAPGLVEILYVEDSPQDVEMAMQALKEAGIANRIRVAQDGAEALRLLLGDNPVSAVTPPGLPAASPPPRYRPQIILLDLSLPKIDGLEVLRRIKSDPLVAPIPVVVLTASSRESDWLASKRLGAASYIIKPLDFQNLTRVTPGLSLQWGLLKPELAVRSNLA